MVSMGEESFKAIFNAMQGVMVYVVQRDTYEILFYNHEAKRNLDNFDIGVLLDWKFGKHSCGEREIVNDKVDLADLYTNEFGQNFRVTCSSIVWADKEAISLSISNISFKKGMESGMSLREQQLLMEKEALFNSLPGYVLKISIGEEIILLDASKTFYEFFGGVSKDYLVGDNVVAEDRQFVVTEIKEKGKLGQPISMECRVRDKYGQVVWVQGEGKMIGMEKENPIYLMILLNINTIKETQAELLQERERYRLAVANMADGIFEYYVQEDFLIYHKTFKDSQDGVKRRNYLQTVRNPSAASAESFAKFKEILRGESTGAEIEVYNKAEKRKEWFFCQGNTIFEAGKLKKVIGTFRNIDAIKKEQLKIEERLQFEKKKSRMSDQRFLQVVNQLYDLILEVDLRNREVYVWKDSQAYAPFIPRNESVWDFMASEAAELIHPDFREEVRDAFSFDSLLSAFYQGKKEVVVEVLAKNNMGVYRWHRVLVQPIKQDIEMMRVIIYFRDIHEQKSRENQQRLAIQDALRLAERANAAKGEFLSQMSHDIRTPMNAIMGMTTIAEAQVDNKEKVIDCLAKISSASKYLLGLINNILDMSRIESGKMPLVVNEFSIRELLQEAIVYGFAQGQLKEQEFIVTLKDDTEEIYKGDILRINQILINLLSNAFKYTPPKGKITFNVEMRKLEEKEALLQVSVMDNGIGIEEGFLDKLFIPFEQGEGKMQEEGTGLGLAISQNLAIMMGGQIFVESEVGKGSVFFFELPIKRKDVEVEVPSSGEKRMIDTKDNSDEVDRSWLESLGNARVLLVEDNELNVEIVKTLLEMHNIIVDVARNGQECILMFQRAEENTYLAILMDIQMPIMNGYEATKEIRQMPRSDAKSIPIIAMTANAFPADIQQTRAVGMTEHIAKPIDIQVLFSVLKGYHDEMKEA